MLPNLHPPPPNGATTDLDALLLACHRQEERAQRQLYQGFYALALWVALHYSAHRTEAEELVHDAFLKLFRALAERPFTGHFVPYFRSILINTGIDHYRVHHRRRELLRRFLPAAPQPSQTGDPVRPAPSHPGFCRSAGTTHPQMDLRADGSPGAARPPVGNRGQRVCVEGETAVFRLRIGHLANVLR